MRPDNLAGRRFMKPVLQFLPLFIVLLSAVPAHPNRITPLEIYAYEIFFPANYPGMEAYKRPGHFFPHPVEATIPTSQPPRVTLSLPNSTLGAITEALVRQTGVPLALTTPLLSKKTSLTVQDVFLRDAMRELALTHNLRFIPYGKAHIRFFFPRVINAYPREDRTPPFILVLVIALSFLGFSLLMDLLYRTVKERRRIRERSSW
jgi:hypothetical protein